MSRCKALYHHRPAVGPDNRLFVVLPFAQPTAFTSGCGLVGRSISSPGTTASVFWHRTTLEPHARSGSGATATQCSPREPAFGTRATMACGGLKKKSVRVRRRMGYLWPKFWTIRGRSSSLFSGALHDLRGGRTRFLVPAGSRSQRALSGGPTLGR